jgi:hypothetical protein
MVVGADVLGVHRGWGAVGALWWRRSVSQSKLDDLYDRLTSRKLWLALLSVVFGLWNYAEGRLTPVEFQAVVFGAVTAYTVSEGLTDAAAAWHTSPDTTVRTTVNTNTDPSPPPVVPVKPKRVRKPKVKTDA